MMTFTIITKIRILGETMLFMITNSPKVAMLLGHIIDRQLPVLNSRQRVVLKKRLIDHLDKDDRCGAIGVWRDTYKTSLFDATYNVNAMFKMKQNI